MHSKWLDRDQLVALIDLVDEHEAAHCHILNFLMNQIIIQAVSAIISIHY